MTGVMAIDPRSAREVKAAPPDLSAPSAMMTWRLWRGNEANAELIRVTGREKVQVVDHAVVTTHE